MPMDLMRWAGAQARSDEPTAARRARNLISGSFLGVGVVVAFIALLIVPGWQVDHRLALAILGCSLIVGSLLQIVFASTVPVVMNHATSVIGTLVIAVTQILADDPRAIATMGLMYIWIAIFTALYYSLTAAVAHVTIVTVAQIGVLIWLYDADLVPQVIVTVSTCIAAAMIVGWLTRDLRQQLAVDPLTNLANRRGLEQVFSRDLAVAQRTGEPLYVAVLDLDGFKVLNDTHGHAAGDAALIDTATAWLHRVRAVDTLARIGGDEFVLVLPRCSMSEASTVVTRLLRAAPSGMTCSAGIAAYDGRSDSNELVSRADALMYRAKAAGGGRFEIDECQTPVAESRAL